MKHFTLPIIAAIYAAAILLVAPGLFGDDVDSITPTVEHAAAAAAPDEPELQPVMTHLVRAAAMDPTAVEFSDLDTPSIPAAAAAAFLLDVRVLQRRIRQLEHELLLAGTSSETNYGRWLHSIPTTNVPLVDDLAMVAFYAAEWPGIELAPHEGLWIAERSRLDDWEEFGPTVDEAVILYLHPRRLGRSVSEGDLAKLRLAWKAEGHFQ